MLNSEIVYSQLCVVQEALERVEELVERPLGEGTLECTTNVASLSLAVRVIKACTMTLE